MLGIADLRWQIQDELCVLHTERGLTKLREMGGMERVCEVLKVDPVLGIPSEQAPERRRLFGENRIPESPMTTYWQYIVAGLEDFTLRMLIGCALLSITIALAFQRDEELSWLEGVAILATVVAVTNIQAVQDYTKELSFRRMNAVSNNMMVAVLRDGKRMEILRYDVVVGDVIAIGVGDVLEADGILLEGADVEADESALTGEPEDMKKDTDECPFLFSGSAVKSGSGTYLATAVGINSVNGKITALVRGQDVAKQVMEDDNGDSQENGHNKDMQNNGKASADVKVCEVAADEDEGEDEEKSVLRGKLDAMVGKIAYFAFGSAGISTVVMLVRYVIHNHLLEDSDWDWQYDPNEILQAVVTGIAIVVVAVPEGLPLAVTLSLSLSMKKMLKDNNLVKHLDATETMGSATTICSDKTGTLTQNRMSVTRAFIGGKEFASGNSKETACGKVFLNDGDTAKELQALVCQNIIATRADGAEIDWNPEADRWDQKGNKTDCAMLAFTKELGVDYKEMRDRPEYYVTRPGDPRPVWGLKMYPFSSLRKRSGQALPLVENKPDGPCRLFVKGASEIVLSLCNNEMRLDGSIVPMAQERRDEIQSQAVEKFAEAAMRTIALACADFDTVPDWDEEISIEESERLTGLQAKTYRAETNLTFLGVMGIIDPIREGVPRAIQQCNLAGVDVRMVTGDHKATALAIAKDCGILRRGIDFKNEKGEPLVHSFTVMNGDEFRRRVLRKGKLDQAAFDVVWPHLRVLARSSPEDKHTLVSGLMESTLCDTDMGRELKIHPEPQVVAVTGDGTNDAPALRRADVGFAMKITGTRVAQDAADILLMDDNFESVVKACMWGRNVYDSICKFLQFQLTVNVSAVTLCLIGACAVGGSPLGVVQMLWVNLIMDSLGALALASELPTEDLLNRKPYGKKCGLISYCMVCNIAGQSVYQLVVLLILFFGGAGPPCTGDCDPETFHWNPGGLLDIPSGIGRGHHDPPTIHYTVIFNAFVFMQLFNWLNARKLHHELNVFSGICANLMFLGIWLACLIFQVIMVEFAALGGGNGENKAFKTRSLDTKHWILCLAVGVFSMFWYVIIAVIGRALRPLLAKKQDEGDSGGKALPQDSLEIPMPPPSPVPQVGNATDDNLVIPKRERPLHLKSVVRGIIWGQRLTKAVAETRDDTSSAPSQSTGIGSRGMSGNTGDSSFHPLGSLGSLATVTGSSPASKNAGRHRKDKKVAKEYSSATLEAGRPALAPGGVLMHSYSRGFALGQALVRKSPKASPAVEDGEL